MSIAWHCDFEDCDEWAGRGSDEARDWVITTYNDGRTWHFCSKAHERLARAVHPRRSLA
jgi:hypothetical protein